MSAEPKDVFGHGTEEDLTLEHLGYQQGMTGLMMESRIRSVLTDVHDSRIQTVVRPLGYDRLQF